MKQQQLTRQHLAQRQPGENRHITGFYLETLLLIAVFVAIILVLTQVFGLGRAQSGQAKLLTNAVTLAQNAAEAVSASDSPETLLSLLDENGNARPGGQSAILASYDADMTPDADGCLTVEVTWEPADREERLVYSTVHVWYEGMDEPVYSLRTAVFLGEVSP